MNLTSNLPRIPAVKTFADFRAFSQAGRELAHWHLEYETVACHPGVAVVCGKEGGHSCPPESHVATGMSPLLMYRVTKMKFGKTKDASGKSVNDMSTFIYNEFITLKNIPLAAYDSMVNGNLSRHSHRRRRKPALEWVIERQSVSHPEKGARTIIYDL